MSAGRPATVATVAAGLMLLALTLVLELGAGVQRLDALAREVVRVPGTPERPWWLSLLLLPGQRGVLWPALLVLAGLLSWRGRNWRPVLVVAAALILLAVTVLGLKAGVGRTAPAAGVDLLGTAGRSYPSGHAANTVLGLGLGALLLTRGSGPVPPARRGAVLGFAGVLCLLGGLAVVMADYHWLSDVVAGWVLGGLLLLALHGLVPDAQGPAASPAGRGARAPWTAPPDDL